MLVVVSYKAEPFSLSFFSKRSAAQVKPDMTIIPIMTQKTLKRLNRQLQ